MIDPMIPGRAAAALPASLPKSLARALSLFLTHSLTLLGFFGGLDPPPPPPPPVRAVMMVDTKRPIIVKTAVMVRPCSLKTSLIFSLSDRSPSMIFSAVCRIRENCEASSLRFCDTISRRAERSSLRSFIQLSILLRKSLYSSLSLISSSLSYSFLRCLSMSDSFPAFFVALL